MAKSEAQKRLQRGVPSKCHLSFSGVTVTHACDFLAVLAPLTVAQRHWGFSHASAVSVSSLEAFTDCCTSCNVCKHALDFGSRVCNSNCRRSCLYQGLQAMQPTRTLRVLCSYHTSQVSLYSLITCCCAQLLVVKQPPAC